MITFLKSASIVLNILFFIFLGNVILSACLTDCYNYKLVNYWEIGISLGFWNLVNIINLYNLNFMGNSYSIELGKVQDINCLSYRVYILWHLTCRGKRDKEVHKIKFELQREKLCCICKHMTHLNVAKRLHFFTPTLYSSSFQDRGLVKSLCACICCAQTQPWSNTSVTSPHKSYSRLLNLNVFSNFQL